MAGTWEPLLKPRIPLGGCPMPSGLKTPSIRYGGKTRSKHLHPFCCKLSYFKFQAWTFKKRGFTMLYLGYLGMQTKPVFYGIGSLSEKTRQPALFWFNLYTVPISRPVHSLLGLGWPWEKANATKRRGAESTAGCRVTWGAVWQKHSTFVEGQACCVNGVGLRWSSFELQSCWKVFPYPLQLIHPTNKYMLKAAMLRSLRQMLLGLKQN